MAEPNQFCPFCGSTNPAGYNFCLHCHHALPVTGPAGGTAAPEPPDTFQLVTARPDATSMSVNVGQGFWGILFLYLGIPMLLTGIGALVVASFVSQGVASYNQTCAMIPGCVPEGNPSGAIAAAGVVILLVAIVLVWAGYNSYRNRA